MRTLNLIADVRYRTRAQRCRVPEGLKFRSLGAVIRASSGAAEAEALQSCRRSGDEVQAQNSGVRRFGRFGGFDPTLVRLDGFGVCVGGLVRDQPDFRLVDDDMGRVCGTYGAHVPYLLHLHFQFCRDSFTAS